MSLPTFGTYILILGMDSGAPPFPYMLANLTPFVCLVPTMEIYS